MIETPASSATPLPTPPSPTTPRFPSPRRPASPPLPMAFALSAGLSPSELMDLEDIIGDVKTGLSDEFILKNLRTSMHVQQSTSSSLGSPSQSASGHGTCIVCQIEYEENERIETLDCGHSYHADCIKRWLAVKNICPICKAPALVADKSKG
uniref:RING-type E3 ubiquitin transferase n=1 Tax=Elaeis guineensis var. tenera TaxID=51953 RepID=A0A6I9R0K1_ELAGV|nr:probable E3 ubiquitin-protein ligase ZFP1 [Elaeis guineensis]